jgi:hypothetical protein
VRLEYEVIFVLGRPDIEKLARTSSLIFNGTVIELGASSVANLPPRESFAVVRIERSLRSDPALGNLRSKIVTVDLVARGEVQSGDAAIFFTLDWIQGGGMAVHELAHTDTHQEDEVTAAVARLPELHLSERLASALLIVVAEVAEIRPTPFEIRWRNAPQWATASFKISDALRGKPTAHTTVLFPTSGRPSWFRAPRLSEGQRAIFLLHRVPDWPPLPESGQNLTSETFTVLDPADVQPESQRPLIEKLLREGGSHGVRARRQHDSGRA